MPGTPEIDYSDKCIFKQKQLALMDYWMNSYAFCNGYTVVLFHILSRWKHLPPGDVKAGYWGSTAEFLTGHTAPGLRELPCPQLHLFLQGEKWPNPRIARNNSEGQCLLQKSLEAELSLPAQQHCSFSLCPIQPPSLSCRSVSQSTSQEGLCIS